MWRRCRISAFSPQPNLFARADRKQLGYSSLEFRCRQPSAEPANANPCTVPTINVSSIISHPCVCKMSNNGTSDQPESEYVPSLSSTPAPARQRTTTFAHFGKTASDYCTTSFATVTAPEPHRNDIANGTRRTLQELYAMGAR
jgi:hypothetical protein